MMWKQAALYLVCVAAFGAPLQVRVHVALGPNPEYAGGYNPWAGVVVNQLRVAGGASTVPGIGTSPTGYTDIEGGTITHADIINSYSNFTSWLGTTPAAGAFAGQYGAYLYFPFSVEAQGGQVSLSNVSISATSSNPYGPPNYLGAAYTYNDPSDTYRTDLVGVIGGAPVAAGTPGTTPVDAIYYTGYAVGFFLDSTFPGGSNQQWLDYTAQAAWLLGNFPMTVCVSATSGTDSGSDCASVNFYSPNAIPEPGTWGMAGAGLLALSYLRRRK